MIDTIITVIRLIFIGIACLFVILGISTVYSKYREINKELEEKWIDFLFGGDTIKLQEEKRLHIILLCIMIAAFVSNIILALTLEFK